MFKIPDFFSNLKFNKSFKNLITRTALLSRIPVPVLITAGTVLVLILLFPYTSTVQTYNIPKIGEAAKETIIAPFTFDIIRSPEELQRERQKAASNVLLVLQYSPETRIEIRRKMARVKDLVVNSSKKNTSDSAKAVVVQMLSKDLSKATVEVLCRRPNIMDDAMYMADEALDKGILSELLVTSNEKLFEIRSKYNTAFENYMLYQMDFVSLRKGTVETTVRASDLPVKEIALEGMIHQAKNIRKYDDEALSTLYEVLFLYLKPNVQVNNSLTTVRREKASRDVLEITGKVIKDTEIVRKHQEVTAEIVEKLRSLQIATDKMGNHQEKRKMRAGNAGRLLLILFPLLFVCYYIQRYEKPLMESSKHLGAFALLVLLQILLFRGGMMLVPKLFEQSYEVTSLVPEYLIPLSTGAILAAILFNFRIAFILVLYCSLLFGVVMGFNQYFFLYALLGGTVSAYSVKNIRYRLHFFKIIPPITLVYIILVSLWYLIRFKVSTLYLFENYAFALVSVVISVFLAMMLTPLFERLFDLTTDMTLVELSDMNHPVLKRLSIEAAGTYNHSVLVGNLAESAAERIGANALLARVASYYHDIGKIEKSDYFVENILPVEKNRHLKLAPSMSALIICSHVKDGVELAIQSRLPKVIQDIIMQHHGTSTVSFFYEKALEQDPHKQVQEQDFRYGGPLPQTREAAIIMLADSVEAASRSLGTSSPKLLRELVKKIIRDKFLSSQLDQSDLTLKDLDLIVDGFMPVLQGIFHSRVEYPKGA